MPQSSATTSNYTPENYDPLSPEQKEQLPEITSELRQKCPVHHYTLTKEQLDAAPANDLLDGRPADMYSLLRHADVEAALLNPAEFSSSEGVGIEWMKPQEGGGALTNADGEAHTRSRQLTQPALSPKVINRLGPMLQERIDDLIDGFADRGECELFADFALPLSSGMLGYLLGIPSDRHGELQEWAFGIMAMFGGDQAGVRRGEAAMMGISNYISEVGAERLAAIERGEEPADGFTKLLTAEDDKGQRLSHNELLNVVIQLIGGGFDSTASAIVNGVAMFCRNPSERKKLEENPQLIGTAVEEVVRYMAPTDGMFRTTAQDIEIAGTLIPAGTKVRLNLASANMDDATFENPQEFKIDRHRSELQKHLSFGKGIHTCIGNSLARQELKLAFSTLFRRLPTLQLKPGAEPTWNKSTFLYGYDSLPVVWDPSTVRPRTSAADNG
jgi:cytochrome P450